ncbi:ATP-grasp domain-containing protein [Chryseobacterium aquaticum]|uniref:ATP-grasp domain-containing protein n=1 Tax=Chryseobacterium aquaticum subsp. greenlandense TaxID=345663 RepID=A0A101CI97_9FLAO|nr:hypothetical protein [Chryseobacterium aquaticum]KUJ56720.1 hypothetical protein AR686_09200 [Chryseobacterium aquaticum subsp. greenlandense]
MILIITHKEDYTADYIINKLNNKKISYFRLNCEDIPKYNFSIDSSLNFNINGIDKFKSVWFRRTKLFDFKNFSLEEQEFLINEYDSFLKNLFSIISTDKWLSNPKNIYSAENKLLQLQYAKSIGFNIPKTIISTNPNQIRDFYFSHNEKIILKPFWNSKLFQNNKTKLLFTNLVDKKHIDDLDNMEITPIIFQEYIEKKIEYRITVVEDEIFVASVDSQKNEKTKIDWRRDNSKFQKDKIPKEIENKCLELVKMLGLKFGAIDLIQDEYDNFYFLEINANGQWVWIESDTGLTISDSIINFLNA